MILDDPGVGHFVCAGDTALNPQAAPLRYGTNTQVGKYLCKSRFNGMTCTNTRTGHGFFIAIQGYRSF